MEAGDHVPFNYNNLSSSYKMIKRVVKKDQLGSCEINLDLFSQQRNPDRTIYFDINQIKLVKTCLDLYNVQEYLEHSNPLCIIIHQT